MERSKITRRRLKVVRELRKSEVANEEGFFESIHRNFLSVVYISFVRRGQTKGYFKFKRRDSFQFGGFNMQVFVQMNRKIC